MFTELAPAFSSVPETLREQVFLVGGAIRDHLLGLSVSEFDWLVVGVPAQQLLDLGFVEAGPGMPVYLHPQTGEEYALARRERKTGPGYQGFEFELGPHITLADDLRRRDFTVNAVALSAVGELFDPFNGQADIAAARLRHVSEAFVEDPLRILRAARFAAKLGACGFRLAHATHTLMCQMVEAGAVEQWQPQRTGEELMRAMGSAAPWRFFEVLQAVGALGRWLPCLADAMRGSGGHQAATPVPVRVLQRACRQLDSPQERLAAMLVSAEVVCTLRPEQAQIDQDFYRLLDDAQALKQVAVEGLSASQLNAWFRQTRAWQDGERFARALRVLSVQPGRASYVPVAPALAAAKGVDASEFQAQGLAGRALGEALAEARLHAIAQVLDAYQQEPI